MKLFILINSFWIALSIVLIAEEQSSERKAWLLERREMMARAKTNFDEQAITDLSRVIRGIGRNINRSSNEAKELYYESQTLFLSKPNHASYYQKKIEAMRTEVLANDKKSEAEISKMQEEGLDVLHYSDFDRFCSMDAFPTLMHLPSPETVKVLGFYLNDPLGRDGKTLSGNLRNPSGDYGGGSPCNAELATWAIRNLEIEHPPFPPLQDRVGPRMSEEEVDAWKGWWNEIKDGKRTYRFIGSPIEYGADGPASKEVIERAKMNRKRDEERTTGKRTASSAGEAAAVGPKLGKPSTIAGILAACAFVGGAVWYFLRGRRTA